MTTPPHWCTHRGYPHQPSECIPPLTEEELAYNRWASEGQPEAEDMTDHTPLTDEELAAIESTWPPHNTILRLIADLRASRAEAAEAWSRGRSYGQAVAESELAACRAEVERIAEARYDAEFEAAELQAEVERLRTFLDDTDRKRYEAEVCADWRAQQ